MSILKSAFNLKTMLFIAMVFYCKWGLIKAIGINKKLKIKECGTYFTTLCPCSGDCVLGVKCDWRDGVNYLLPGKLSAMVYD